MDGLDWYAQLVCIRVWLVFAAVHPRFFPSATRKTDNSLKAKFDYYKKNLKKLQCFSLGCYQKTYVDFFHLVFLVNFTFFTCREFRFWVCSVWMNGTMCIFVYLSLRSKTCTFWAFSQQHPYCCFKSVLKHIMLECFLVESRFPQHLAFSKAH